MKVTVSVDLQPVRVQVACDQHATAATYEHFRFVAQEARRRVDTYVDDRRPGCELFQRTCRTNEAHDRHAAQQTRLQTAHTYTQYLNYRELGVESQLFIAQPLTK